jgi:hypothetical protein
VNDNSVSKVAPLEASLDRWLGRRDAFALIAGRCSAADVECLREIRNNKLYVKPGHRSWDEFCRLQLKTSRRKIDTAIGQLDKYGRPFFHAIQALRLTEAEFCAIQEYVREEGVMLEGQLVPWTPENGARITEGLTKLRAIAAPKGKRCDGFEALLKRFDALNQQLEKLPERLEDRQRITLGNVLQKLSFLAERRGVKLIQR